MKFTHHHHVQHHHKKRRENLKIYLNGVLVLIIKNIQKMQTISINIDDNQGDLDVLKGQIADSVTALSSAIEAGNAALASLQAFQISFTASVATTQPPTA
jgi:hypothetical protein